MSKNLAIFKKIAGLENLGAVVMASSMWNRVPEQEGQRREDELVATPEFWGEFVRAGSRSARFENTPESALAIVDWFIGRDEKVVLGLQKEIVDQGKLVSETEAGREIECAIVEAKDMFRREMEELEGEKDVQIVPRDQLTVEDIAQQERHYRVKVKALEGALARLRVALEELQQRKEKALSAQIQQLKEEREEFQRIIDGRLRDLKKLESEAQMDEAKISESPPPKYTPVREGMEKCKSDIVRLQRQRASRNHRINQSSSQKRLFEPRRTARFDDVDRNEMSV